MLLFFSSIENHQSVSCGVTRSAEAAVRRSEAARGGGCSSQIQVKFYSKSLNFSCRNSFPQMQEKACETVACVKTAKTAEENTTFHLVLQNIL